MYADPNSILTKVRVLLGLDPQQDQTLSVVIEMMMEEVTNYCIIQSVPQKLENTMAQMVIDYLKINPMGIEKLEGSNVKSIQRGDTTISYNTSESTVNLQEFIKGYHERLMHFRKMKMR